jgi:hypothetical protein
MADASGVFDWRWFLGGVGFMVILVIASRML